MAERKATNKYYPPDWDPSKGSINKYLKQHPLRSRAKKLDEGILTVRFEMPFNIWCGHCENHIGRGVRFNAEKKKVGEYYSTAILSFRMKCPSCGGWMEIRTDPKNSEYVVLEGARRKMEDTPTTESMNFISPKTVEEAQLMATNPFYRLEHGIKDQKFAKGMIPKLSEIQSSNEVLKNDYDTSRLLRRKFREEKLARKDERRNEERIRRVMRDNGLKVFPERADDVLMARNIVVNERRSGEEKEMESVDEAIERIQKESIFPNNKSKEYKK